MSSITVMTESDISRSLSRIAHEIIERNKTSENLILVGMHTRGAPLAERLAGVLHAFTGIRVPTGTLDISAYRDDIERVYDIGVSGTKIPTPVDGNSVILVDDVLFTGRSIRAAMDALIDLGRPVSIQLVVLVDRGHRELPIKADYVGKNIPSARNEEINVMLHEIDGKDEVVINKNLREDHERRKVTGGKGQKVQ